MESDGPTLPPISEVLGLRLPPKEDLIADSLGVEGAFEAAAAKGMAISLSL